MLINYINENLLLNNNLADPDSELMRPLSENDLRKIKVTKAGKNNSGEPEICSICFDEVKYK
jgi:hypothetical protein